jgi:hypothetical protein
MNENLRRTSLPWTAVVAAFVVFCAVGAAAVKNMAVVASADSKLADVALADLTKLCKGTAKAWPDGKSFVLVVKNPDSLEMHGVMQKLFGNGVDVRVAIAKLNETRQAVRIVDSDDDLLRAVDSTPGAIGVVDVYAINSSVKVLRIDGKLPFDVGYPLKVN